jgi:predicted RND superfamily exporter protein
VPVYLTVAILPVILVAVGVADELHVFTCFLRRRHAAGAAPQDAVVRATMDEMAAPVVTTSLTTAVGFLSFVLSPIGPVRVFGLFMAVGVLFCMLWSLTAWSCSGSRPTSSRSCRAS